MIDAELKRYIDLSIRQQLQIITSGAAGASTPTTEDINSLMPGMPTLTNRPIMHPYGFVSRAKKGTISVTAQQGDHPGNKLTLGHRDGNAPSVDEGESAQYSFGGYRVVCKNGEIFVGKGEDLEHMVVGETLKTFLLMLLDLLIAHQHYGNLGYPTSVPITAQDFTDLKADYIANDKILAKDGGRY